MCAACRKMCRHVCPTFFAWKSDSPTPHGRSLLVHQDARDIRSLDDRGIEVLYQCLECSHCLTWCLPEIDVASIVETTRIRLVTEGRYPVELSKLESAVKKHHNPFNEKHSKRNDWLSTRGEGKRTIAYFSGCTAAYREKEIAQDTVSVLATLGYSVVVSPDEWCCGSPLLRTGFLETALEQARHNVEVFNSIKADEILVTCPGCYRVLTKDYPAHGLKLNKPVKHVTELLDAHIDELPVGEFEGNVAYHDPCHLGRHSEIYDQPRKVIDKITGNRLVEMERHGDNAMCCGNGAGLRTLFPEKAKTIGAERIRHANQVEASILVTSCPFCKNMFVSQAESDLKVLDLPELVCMAQQSKKTKSEDKLRPIFP